MSIVVFVALMASAVGVVWMIAEALDIVTFKIWNRFAGVITRLQARTSSIGKHDRAALRREWQKHCDKKGFISWGEWLCKR